MFHLIEDAHYLSCAHHDQLIFLLQFFQRFTHFGRQRLFVLCQCSVEIHCNKLNLCRNHLIGLQTDRNTSTEPYIDPSIPLHRQWHP